MRTALALAIAWAAATLDAGGRAPEPTPLERLVPADAVAFLQVEDLPAFGKAYQQSALAEAVGSSRLLRYFQAVAGAGLDFAAVVLSGLSPEDFRALFGRHAGAVLLDFRRPAEMRQNPPVVFLVEAADAQALDKLLREQLQLFALLSNQPLVTEERHGETTILQVTPPNGRDVAFCFLGNVLALGARPALTRLLDAQTDDRPRLATAPAYQAVRKHLATPAGGLRAYLNVRGVIEKAGLARGPRAQEILHGLGLANAQAAAVAMDFAGRQVRDRIYLHVPGPSTGVLRFYTDGKPVRPALAPLLARRFTVVGTMALQDVGIWDRLYRMIADFRGEAAAGNLALGANIARENLGIQIKEGLLDCLTGELVFAADLSKLDSFAGVGRQPTPQEIPFVLAARLRNVPALRETLDRIAGNERLWEQGIERAIQKHQGVDVATFTVPVNPNVQPTYALFDDLLLFSIRREPVIEAIEAWQAREEARPAAAQAAAEPVHVRLDVRDAELLGTGLDLIQAEAPEQVRRLVPDLARIVKGLPGYRAVLRRQPQGYSLTAVSDLGTLGNLALIGLIADQFHAVVARRVEADFGKYAAALEEYRAEHDAYPETLEQLVPDHLPNVVRDRFQPARAYGYSRGQPGPDGTFPDAWVLTSVGPDKRADIPVEQFDPQAWAQLLRTDEPEEIERLKRLVYQFRKNQFADERKNDDEGDLFRLGGRALREGAPEAPAPAPKGPRPGTF